MLCELLNILGNVYSSRNGNFLECSKNIQVWEIVLLLMVSVFFLDLINEKNQKESYYDLLLD